MKTISVEFTADELKALLEVLDYRRALRDGLTPPEASAEAKVKAALVKG